jgi:hypothetical protein
MLAMLTLPEILIIVLRIAAVAIWLRMSRPAGFLSRTW